ncbi:uncharacterized protein LOC131434351 [Malaya genurostris]|uniref:uncharacterized protein LOC131434351 n=1 Tax=Malaya genurostris TaxID=325434 RepID=UPI0026F3BBB1|nr:uncharacterized protein LOC131434351 [Malaya genurostris]
MNANIEQVRMCLADPNFNQPGHIDIILGSDVFLALLVAGQVKDNLGIPVAQNTIFGWIISGNHAIYTSEVRSNHSIINLHCDVDINRTLRQFWEVEEVPKQPELTTTEQATLDFFRSTLTRDKTGRFIVRLPFDDSKPALGESVTSAIKRLRSLERRFQQNLELARQYSDFLDEYLALGHMEQVPDHQIDVDCSKCFYLPHHSVLKAESTTTKLRVVFDASCASSNGLSLNDRLMAGPNVNRDLFTVFLRFRSNQVAYAADVEKMYRQVLVHPADRDFQRIVWRSSLEQPIKHYRLCTVTYGTKSAPFLAIEAMKQAARNYESVYPEAAEIIKLDTYVDDLLSGARDVHEAKRLIGQITEIMNSAGFNLRKSTTNVPELFETLAVDEQLPVDVKWTDQPNTVKALGIQWQPKEAAFSFKVCLPLESVNTKRQLLSDSSKLFDPFGWLAPVIIRIKILFQQLWLSDISWDDPLLPAIEAAWTDIKGQLRLVELIRVPRFASNYNGKMELHGFSDASEVAYGAVVYTRARDAEGNIVVNLLAAKTRVAPIKQVSLPRLELNAAVLLAELMERISIALSHLEVEMWAWTDSSIVLQWLSAHPRK